MILKLATLEEFGIAIYPGNEPNEDKTWYVELDSSKNGDLIVRIVRFEAGHDGQVFVGRFKRGFKDGESCEDIEVTLPCGMNSFNDKLKVSFETKHHETDETITRTRKYDHWAIEEWGKLD